MVKFKVKNEIDIKSLPEKYQKVFEDKNKNGKPDFFEDSTLEIIKKLYNLFTQKNPQLYGYKKVNPSTFKIILFVLIVMAIAVFAIQFLPIIIFFGIAYFSNKKKKDSKTKVQSNELENFPETQLETKNPQINFVDPSSPINLTNNIQDSFSNWIRIVLLLGIVGYCIYLASPYLQDKFF